MSGNSPHQYALKKISGIFDQAVIPNSLRGLYLEHFVEYALLPEWGCTEEWAAYDFVHKDGTKLELKQAAVLQTWSTAEQEASRTSFSIRAAKGEYKGLDWVEGSGRRADIYLFAFHPGKNKQNTDQRDAGQWEFYPVPTDRLPVDQKTISIEPIRRLVKVIPFGNLASEIDIIRRSIRTAVQ